ncbi:MAG: class II aldolase [Anaerolineae bacterium]|nr:class II aldolase [Anaerolineae bacterium]
MTTVLTELVQMSQTLGEPARDYVILGEGNTSARVDEKTFCVKASGTSLHGISEKGFVQINFEPVLALFEQDGLSDTAVKDALNAARVDQSIPFHPSVETTFHAMALTIGEANFIGHTHPTAVNSILCSQQAEAAIAGRLFPDEIVVCGPGPAFVPYTDPGLPLAKAIKESIERYQDENGRSPKVILMKNHGLIALGKTADEVLRITAMYVKTARIILGTYALGGPNFLTKADVARIDSRPDEHYRRKMLEKS